MKAVCRTRNDMLNFVGRVCNEIGEKFEKPYQLTVKPFKRDRSLGQNARWHAMVNELALFTGHTPSEMKDILKSEIGIQQSFSLKGKIVDGPKPTSNYDVEEMSNLIEQTFVLAAEIGYAFQNDGL